jgi:oligopeptidase B
MVLNVPFLDPLTALIDPTLPLTSSDHEEFGNPIEDPEIFDLIHDYSPY